MIEPSPYKTFELERQTHNDTLNLELFEYRHKETGAPHIHIANDSNEQVFLVAFRTMPMDSTGVAHILEHTVLCGSEQYPVRDPFFMMIKRSLNTFMNAFTASDWTAYPFASQNQKDFDNLLKVYLDAVFFPTLDPLDFAQEGHRLEFSESDNPNSDLTFKGVVFNEMKGAMSSVNSQLYDHLNRYLFPTNTYHFNSGGDPEHITDLTYDQLKSFYKSHYHPSNAIFMTFGNQAPAKLQQQFEELALQRFTASPYTISVSEEKRYHAPLNIETSFSVSDPSDLKKNSHHVLAWLLPKSTDTLLRLEAQFMSNALLDNSASPLRKVLETTSLGSSPSSLCGLEEGSLEMSFMCGIEGSEAAQADEFETLILNTLQEVVDQGIPQEQLESVLHQLEFSQREIGGDHFPYGLQLMLTALPGAIHRSDPFALLDIAPALDHIRSQLADPNYIKGLVKQFCIDNPHRVRLTMKPDLHLRQHQVEQEQQKLKTLQASLNEVQKQDLIALAQKLSQRQQQENDPGLLPKVGVEDIPAEIHYPKPVKELSVSDHKLTLFKENTNGICYQETLVDCSHLDSEQLQALPRLSDILVEVGIGNQDYLSVQQRQSKVSGGFHSQLLFRPERAPKTGIQGYVMLSGKALQPQQEDLQALLSDTWYHARFDELQRIKEITQQEASHQLQSITGQGHQLAMTAASAGLHPMAELRNRWFGLQGIKQLVQLADLLDDEQRLKEYGEQLQQLHNAIKDAPKSHLWISDHLAESEIESLIQQQWQSSTAQATSVVPAFSQQQKKQAWLCNTQVNFCAKAFPTVTDQHEDSASLQVLGAYLRNGFLHTAIREQGGAYGGGSSQDSQLGIFRFYSYRDPRLTETLTDFDQAIDWFLHSKQKPEQLEEAILNIISDVDKPGSPAGEAKGTFYNTLFGRSAEDRKAIRERFLSVNLDSMRTVAERYLYQKDHSAAVVTFDDNRNIVEQLAFEVLQLNDQQ